MKDAGDLRIDVLLESYRSGTLKPSDVVGTVYERVRQHGERPLWISIVPEEQALARAKALEFDPHAVSLPLYGIPFAIKDNIDAAGMPTTAACPAFAYHADRSSTAVEKILAAGAILIGKTNMDQFATGLVGVRTPYGACSSVFNERYISGGSSSGSAVAVARGMASFSLGTDTAGSGRVPAAFNGLIGLKPTRGLISTAGVVPACRSLDCVSIFATTSADAQAVWEAAVGFDERDPYSRVPAPGDEAAPWLSGATFRFGTPKPDQLEFFGDTEAQRLYEAAIRRLTEMGGEPVEIDFRPFQEAAQLLYSGPWVAERTAAVGGFTTDHANDLDPTVGGIIEGGRKYSAVDSFEAQYKLAALRQRVEAQWEDIDVLVLPTTGTIYTTEQVQADPIRLNTNLGYYTNFVNLLDLAAVAAPAGFRTNGLPFGISFIGRAFSDRALLHLAARWTNTPIPAIKTPGCIEVAVVGAHLTGMPLNRELTSRGARLIRTTRTTPHYRLYALANTTPPKPGLVRDEPFTGPGIELEIWAVPENEFGSFVAGIPAPLGIGTVVTQDGSSVKCFICEPYAIAGSKEITDFGGWRKYLAAKAG